VDVVAQAEFVPASVVGDLRRLEGLAHCIFGRGDRPAQWFARKLHRECIDPELSRLAVMAGTGARPGGPAPEHWLGYVLVGAPPSLAPALRTAGTGVVPWARRRGIATGLLESVVCTARTRGHSAVRLLAAPERVDFYRHRGFVLRGHAHTLLGFGRARGAGAPIPWVEADPLGHDGTAHEVAGQCFGAAVPELWGRTLPELRGTIAAEHGVVLRATLEGRALVVHQALGSPERTTEHLESALDGLPGRVAEGVPILLAACEEVSSITQTLTESGWAVVQRIALLERSLDKVRRRGDDADPPYRAPILRD
jgi:GNAT superfamily N-acetyltransferase